MIRILISFIVLLFIYFYGESFVFLASEVSFASKSQQIFFISFGVVAIISFLFLKGGAFIAIFEHELTHNIFAVLTFNKPVGFHVRKGEGGLFEYSGRGNIFITLSPYFFQTFSFMILPLYLVFNPEVYNVFFIIFGALTGYHTSSTIKEFSFRQPDIRENGLLLSTILVIFLNIITYGIILSFVISRWAGIKDFLFSGIIELFDFIKNLELFI